MKEKVTVRRLKVKVKVSQSCLTLCEPMDYIAHGILQAGILEWVAIPFFMGSAQPRNRTRVSCTAGGFFISWATREAHYSITRSSKLEKRLRERDKKSVTIKAAETLSLMKKRKEKQNQKILHRIYRWAFSKMVLSKWHWFFFFPQIEWSKLWNDY